MRIRLIIAIFVLPVMLFGQLKIVVEGIPVRTNRDDLLYFASNINSWNPSDTNFVFTRTPDGNFEITLEKFEGELNYKITRGSWKEVECDSSGENIDNRKLTFSDTTVNITVASWKDLFVYKKDSRSKNVYLIDSTFVIPKLERERKVWVYLPDSYYKSEKSYPVIYMHDGQNLFDSQTSYAGEWGIDETLDEIIHQGAKEAIIIGVDNGGQHRINELTPFENKDYGGGEAKYYMNFIIKDLKNYVDENYRTKSDRDNTYIMGSSLGGLVSFYAVMSKKNIFSKAAVMSPSFWFNNKIYFIPGASKNLPVKIYFVAGELEGSEMIENIDKMVDKMLKYNYPKEDIVVKKIKDGEHNEKLWREEFKDAYLWLLNN